MPYTDKEKKLMTSLIKQYGLKKAQDVYYGMEANTRKGKGPKNLFGSRTLKKKH